MNKCMVGVVLENKEIRNTNIFIMKIDPGKDAGHALPGQYVNIRCSKGTSPLLRRPISVLGSDPVTKVFEIGYEVRGQGTEYLSGLKPGDMLDVIGPLGNRFEVIEEYRNIAVVGGGIGVFPLIHLLETSSDKLSKHAFFGFQTKEKVLFELLQKPWNCEFHISTDDNSYGYGGFVTDLFQENLDLIKPDVVFTCGPMAMMKKCAAACESRNIPCFVSLEERMACGIGACLGCACKTKREDGYETYGHVCKNGPVFNARSVVF